MMKLRQVKSECPSNFMNKKIKKERTKTPLRYSRRLRKLPPEKIQFFDNIRDELKRSRNNDKIVISQPSAYSYFFSSNKKRQLRLPQKIKNSKEVISIFSAPKICIKGSSMRKISEEMPVKVKVKGITVQPNITFKRPLHPLSPNPVMVTKVKKERTSDVEKILNQRKKFVLEVLNKGNIKDIEKLPTIGSKTAEMIILYRFLERSLGDACSIGNKKMESFYKMWHR
ncbi:uncharacterized protein LOC126734149 isoform X2 [Anthonomus grandis grandis]|uniref:uncharacterized protein LOC126734149 isoform X2 n=1 Tax=Anthonomus grandis grandis TaxID=2921223 RepID=UPI002165683F|nr:uncharacterized protein LOC126734149 isoform X2 [Anthonomus grandis grandis]